MNDDPLLDSANAPAILSYIRDHTGTDVKALALKAMPEESWPRALILDQINARQKAVLKMPDWLAYRNIVLPAPDVVEQASSSATARYKAGLVSGGARFADLTAGAGVDSANFAPHFQRGICIEADGVTSRRLHNNLACFYGTKAPDVWHCRAEDAIASLPYCDLIYIDPQRRSQTGRVTGLEDADPDVTRLLPRIFEKARRVLLKASPMLAIDAACHQLSHVAAVHIVEYAGAVRELLLDCHSGAALAEPRAIHAVVINDNGDILNRFSGTDGDDASAPDYSAPCAYLFEPSPAIMKSGLFATLAANYNLAKLAPATHLFTADHDDADFPGHRYKVENVLPVDRKALKRAGITHANIKCRNFPEAPDRLQNRLRLHNGGDNYLFACQLADGRNRLIYARKSGPDRLT